jgi:hypothetical protein
MKYKQVSRADDVCVFDEERSNSLKNVIDTIVGWEGQLCFIECENRAIGSATSDYYFILSVLITYRTT